MSKPIWVFLWEFYHRDDIRAKFSRPLPYGQYVDYFNNLYKNHYEIT